jgi:2-polyprenyl-3-methyl-5-hydroxy-6-metoxy-1,4-benzoquinol methylase
MTPDVSHDEAARMNVLASLNTYVGRTLGPGVRVAFEHDVAPKLTEADKDLSDPRVRAGATVRTHIAASPLYQHWASLRRNIQEMNRQNARRVALRQLDDLDRRAERLNTARTTLALDPATVVPRYLAEADNHLQPGGYHAEIRPGDVLAAATYDLATFVTSAGGFGPKGDSGGRAAARWLKARHPDFKPRRILDLGSAHGNNTLPLAAAFPEAEVVALDAGAPVLRYGHARAQSMGFTNVRFVQRAAEDLDATLGTFDWIQTTMFWHETSTRAVDVVMKRIFAALNHGGVVINLEQPNFNATTPVFDRFLRNWDAWYNNEPFWVHLHEMDMIDAMTSAGFEHAKCFEGGVNPDIEPGHYPPWSRSVSRHDHEHAAPKATRQGYNGESWYLFGAWK